MAPQMECMLVMNEMEDSNSRELRQPSDGLSNARSGARSQTNLNFMIAPTICMKTKAKFRLNLIAPTISMKIIELF